MRDLHLASLADKEVAQEHAKWRHFEMKEKIDAKSRKDPGASFVLDGERPVLSACVAAECIRVSGQESTGEEDRAHADLVKTAKEREVHAWKQFEVYSPVQMGSQTKGVVDL